MSNQLEVPAQTLATLEGITLEDYLSREEFERQLLDNPPARSSKETPEFAAYQAALDAYFKGGPIDAYDQAQALRVVWTKTPEYRYEFLAQRRDQAKARIPEAQAQAALLAGKVERQHDLKMQLQRERRYLAKSQKQDQADARAQAQGAPPLAKTPAQLAKQEANRRAYAARKAK